MRKKRQPQERMPCRKNYLLRRSGYDLKKAADMRFKDYEDAIQSACATRIKANYIVTRNMKDFSESKVTAIKPAELLDRI